MTSRALTIAAYVVTAALMSVLYVAGWIRRFGLVPLGDVVDALRTTRILRVVLIVCWAWLGWHFLAR